MSRLFWAALIVVLVLGAGLWHSGLGRNCCGARQAPSRTEEALARRLRSLPVPVIGRIEGGRVILDLRCLEDEAEFVDQLCALGTVPA